ncbi:MAG: hypothetical protein ACI4AH_04605 [Muribaculaceae bacterium]
MKKALIILAVTFTSVIGIEAQEVAAPDSAAIDSLELLTERFVNLGEVTVTGASVINKSDRKLITPSSEIKQLAANGSDLVGKMQLPDIKVDPMTGALSLYSNGALKLCINGRPVSSEDIRALDASAVERVEYHDTPSMRFGQVDLVLDFIVKVPNSGGRFNVLGQFVPLRGKEWQLNPTLEVNYKRSTFKFWAQDEFMSGFKQWRDNVENYTLEDGTTFTRTETGEPAKVSFNHIGMCSEYMYYVPERDLFSAQLTFVGYNNPHEDFLGTLVSSLDNSTVRLDDRNYLASSYPTLNLYYQHNFSKNKLLMVNVLNGLGRSHSRRTYTEQAIIDSRAGDMLADVFNEIRSYSNTLLGEVDYEQSWNNSRLTLGGSFTYDWSKSRYLTYTTTERMRSSSTYLFSEYWQRFGSRFDASIGLGAQYKHYGIVGGESTGKWLVRPRFNMRYRLDNRNTLRLSYQLFGTAPTLAQLSSVTQQVDGIQQSVGSGNLRTFNTHEGSLRYEYTHKRLYTQFTAAYRIALHPIEQEKHWVDGNVLTSYANLRNAQTLEFRAIARYEIIPEWLSANTTLAWRRFMVHGNIYNHAFNRMRTDFGVTITHWNASLDIFFHSSMKSLQGESITQYNGQGMVFAAGYKYRNFNFNVIALNPFTSDFKLESTNLNSLAGYHRNSHFNFMSRQLVLQVAYNINWGRNYKNGDRRLNNDLERNSVSAAGK